MLGAAAAGLADVLWLDLDPAQQAFVPQDLFVRCEADAWTVAARRGIRYSVERGPVASDPRPVPGTDVVRDRVVQADVHLGPDEQSGLTHTMFIALVDGRWRWVMDPFASESYRAGRCTGRLSFG